MRHFTKAAALTAFAAAGVQAAEGTPAKGDPVKGQEKAAACMA